MGYSPWGHKELDMTERLTLSLTSHLSRGFPVAQWLKKDLPSNAGDSGDSGSVPEGRKMAKHSTAWSL